jgi:hypothetical protein
MTTCILNEGNQQYPAHGFPWSNKTIALLYYIIRSLFFYTLTQIIIIAMLVDLFIYFCCTVKFILELPDYDQYNHHILSNRDRYSLCTLKRGSVMKVVSMDTIPNAIFVLLCQIRLHGRRYHVILHAAISKKIRSPLCPLPKK